MKNRRSFAVLLIPFTAILVGLFPIAARAASAYWLADPASGVWESNANWTAPYPNNVTDIATFSVSNITSISANSEIRLDTVAFIPGASAYTITVEGSMSFIIGGAGIINYALGSLQNFVVGGGSGLSFFALSNDATVSPLVNVTVNPNGNFVIVDNAMAGSGVITNNASESVGFLQGYVLFNGNASAYQTEITNNGATLEGGRGAVTSFNGSSTAGEATLTNGGSSLSEGQVGGTTFFLESSTAADANIANQGGLAAGGIGGQTVFTETSTAGNAIISNEAGLVGGSFSGSTHFSGQANAGTATITNEGGAFSGSEALTAFSGSTSAAAATITNNGATAAGGGTGQTDFTDNATAGNATITNNGGLASAADNGQTNFLGNTTAGNATIFNRANTVTGADEGATLFTYEATLGAGAITNEGGVLANEGGGQTYFYGNSNAGTGTISNHGGSVALARGGNTTFSAGTPSAGSATIVNHAGDVAAAGGGFTEFTAFIANPDEVGSAGNAMITNNAASVVGAGGGRTIFSGYILIGGNAGSATITSQGSTVADAEGGVTQFFDLSSAGSATLSALGGTGGGLGGRTDFYGTADGGTARAITEGNAAFDISSLSTAGMYIGSIEGSGNYFLGSKVLAVGGNDLSSTVTGLIQDGGLAGGAGGAFTKVGAGTFTVSGANTFTGGTMINAGTIATQNVAALGTGPIMLNGGILNPQSVLTSSTLTWNAGNIQLTLDPVPQLALTGDLLNGSAATKTFNLFYDGLAPLQQQYTLVTFAGLTDFTADDFSAFIASASPNLVFTPTFLVTGEDVQIFLSVLATGPILQNSAPVNIPIFADFMVYGPVTTGTPSESNTINSLFFNPGSSLQVFNNLTVTSGNFDVPTGSAAINGGNVIVPGDFRVNGTGTLIAGSNFAIGGDAYVNGGNLMINGVLAATGDMNLNGTLFVNGEGNFGGNLNANASTVTVNGLLSIGRSANLSEGAQLAVNNGGVMSVGRATNINFGSTAIINGQLTSPEVNVNGGGLLKGAGLIVGNVWNNGTVTPGNSPGTLSIDGNYMQTGNGTLEIEPGDLLWVSGNASLAGTLKLVAAGKLKYGQQITFLQAGSISGDFDQILVPNPAKNRGRLLVDGGTGTLLIAPTSYTLVAETGNQRNVAKALDRFITARGNDRETVSIALDLQSAEQYPAAFDQIAPTFYESLADITIEQTNAQNQNLAQRASALRLGARGFQSIGIEAPLVHDKDGKSVMDAKDGKNILSHAPDNKWGVWVQGNGNFARITSANQVPNYRFESGGFLAGADYRWSENFVTGLYGGYQGTLAKYNEGGRTTINSVQFGGYASYDNGGFYADAIVGGGYSAYEVRRPINFSTIDRTARSRPDGGQFTTYLDFGYDWKLGNFTVGPILSGQYTYAGIAPFTETGADSLDLSVGQQNANSLRTSLGGRIAYTWKVSEKFTLIPEGRMFWQHEFLENPRNIGASLDGGNGPSFGYTTSTPDRDAVFAGAGLIGQFGPNWNAYFYYNADFGRQDYISHAISTGLNFKF